MTLAQALWVVSGVTAFMLLPVGAIRMVAYRSGQVDHTPALRGVAMMALGLGVVGLLVFAGLTVWFLAAGDNPW